MLAAAITLTLLGAPPADPTRLAVLEAIYRHQIPGSAAGMRGSRGTYCLQVGDGTTAADPPASVLHRLQGAAAHLYPHSACRVETNGFDRLVRAPGGLRAVTLHVDEITCPTADRCLATGGYYEASLSASGNHYTIERQNGRWVVTGDQMDWIS